MNEQHLSDEAVAACADGYLGGLARERAQRHIAKCAECAAAVQAQRDAAWTLRAAPPPPLPTALVDRLRALPETTPISPLPTAVAPDGSTVLRTSFAPMAAFVPGSAPESRFKARPIVTAAAAVALAGALAAVPVVRSETGDSAHQAVVPRQSGVDVTHTRAPAVITPVSVWRTIGH